MEVHGMNPSVEHSPPRGAGGTAAYVLDRANDQVTAWIQLLLVAAVGAGAALLTHLTAESMLQHRKFAIHNRQGGVK